MTVCAAEFCCPDAHFFLFLTLRQSETLCHNEKGHVCLRGDAVFPELISIPRFERLQEHFQRLPERPPLLQKLRAAVAEADGEAELYVVRQAVTRRKRHETADSKLLMKQIQLATSNTLFLLDIYIYK